MLLAEAQQSAVEMEQGIGILLLGADVQDIRFPRQTIANESEIVKDIAVMRPDIDRETAVRLNPYLRKTAPSGC